MLDNPICQRPFKANVVPGFLRFNPFMFENFFALSLEFAVERRVFQQIITARGVCGIGRHINRDVSRLNLIGAYPNQTIAL